LRWPDAFTWLAYPGIYLVYILARGAASGLYPYPFVDVTELGYGRVFVHAGLLMLAFSGLGLVVIALGRALERPDKELPDA